MDGWSAEAQRAQMQGNGCSDDPIDTDTGDTTTNNPTATATATADATNNPADTTTANADTTNNPADTTATTTNADATTTNADATAATATATTNVDADDSEGQMIRAPPSKDEISSQIRSWKRTSIMKSGLWDENSKLDC